jgi:hypothetical protein
MPRQVGGEPEPPDRTLGLGERVGGSGARRIVPDLLQQITSQLPGRS